MSLYDQLDAEIDPLTKARNYKAPSPLAKPHSGKAACDKKRSGSRRGRAQKRKNMKSNENDSSGIGFVNEPNSPISRKHQKTFTPGIIPNKNQRSVPDAKEDDDDSPYLTQPSIDNTKITTNDNADEKDEYDNMQLPEPKHDNKKQSRCSVTKRLKEQYNQKSLKERSSALERLFAHR